MAAPSVTDETLDKIRERFNISQLTANQRSAIEALIGGKDVFVTTKTGSGKSLIYESLPLLFDENAVTIIIAPLRSIMQEQVERLNGLGFKSVYVSSEKDDEHPVINGQFAFVFGNPELLVGSSKWRDVLRNSTFTNRHKLTVIDEAHTVVQWGESQSEGPAFREWFSRIGELRSLSLHVPVLALTATTSPSNRKKIMKSLCFKSSSKLIIDSPDRPNIKINAVKIANNAELQNVFSWILSEIKLKKQDFDRHIIFCTSIKDCSLIFCFFQRILKPIKLDALVNMYHSKTTDLVKEQTRTDMNSDTGKIKVLICTNAAGMGVNFKKLNNVVHYGVPNDMDTFIQQMGRAGRDGSDAEEVILYKNNKSILKKVDPEMIRLLNAEENACRRSIHDM